MSKRNKRRAPANAPRIPTNQIKLVQNAIDVVIPVYGEFGFLKECLRRLPEAMGDVAYHLYVVDNASPDRTVANAFFAENKVERLITLKTNVGYPGGCNTGVRMGKSPYILILTPDVWYEPNAVAELYKTLMSDSTIGIVCPKLVFPENTPNGRAGTIQHAGIDFNIRGEPSHTFIGWSKDHPKVNVQAEVPACTGASFLTRRAIWNQAGGFFEGYGVGTYEDIEYCLVANSLGFKVMYEPKAEATHHVNATQQAYPLGLNSQIFNVRCGGMLAWTEWTRL